MWLCREDFHAGCVNFANWPCRMGKTHGGRGAGMRFADGFPGVKQKPKLLFAALLLCGWPTAWSATTNSFKNFETAPVHPVAISPDGKVLAVCNGPDGRVELFDLGSELPRARGSVPVGIDPVSVRFRDQNELWVVNHISDSVTVVDVSRRAVTRLLVTRDGPADVVFAGNPERAFVSCPPENVVQVIDPASLEVVRTIAIEAERPRALAVSPDGSKVYAAIFESGNSSTILAPRFTTLAQFPLAGPADFENGPHRGMNPAPNMGTNFVPALSTNLPVSNPPPRVSLIVKKNADGRWMDDNGGDWTSYVSGTNAPFTGRVPGWDVVDRDIAVIDTGTLQVSYVERLMNICMGLAVNPVSGEIALVGSDGLNEVRFEPALQGIFTRMLLGLVRPDLSARVVDLNPHLDYTRRNIPVALRRDSLGDPRGAAWNADGTRLYVTGMGSDNLAVFDAQGKRLGRVDLPGGPTGIAVDEARGKIYVLNRFASSLSVVDAVTLGVDETLPMYDPTPTQIKEGRPHFYGTIETSGLGQAACASCHLDGRMDRLAWDLGSQIAPMKNITSTNRNFGSIPPASTNHFHPMKGPMVTQTLQDIIGHEPFHWRGDRDGLEEFNPTFKELQGADEELTDAEMQEFEDFLATIHFPPNRRRNFDNSLPTNLPLPGHVALGRGVVAKGMPLPNGDALAGMNFFRGLSCAPCHALPSGLGPDFVFRNNVWRSIPSGPNGERHVALTALERSDNLPFKVPHLRNLSEKVGLNFSGTSLSGFGFFHDGRVDTLTRFIQDGFDLESDKQTADLIAFLLSFSGSDLPVIPQSNNTDLAPGGFSRDVPAAVGRQLLLGANSTELDLFVARANSSTGRVQLVVKGIRDGMMRGWVFQSGVFRPDDPGPSIDRLALLALASTDNKFLFTLVPAGTGIRLGIDRDEDGVLDFAEAGLQGLGVAGISGAVMDGEWLKLTARGDPDRRPGIEYKSALNEAEWRTIQAGEGSFLNGTWTLRVPIDRGEKEGYFRLEVRP